MVETACKGLGSSLRNEVSRCACSASLCKCTVWSWQRMNSQLCTMQCVGSLTHLLTRVLCLQLFVPSLPRHTLDVWMYDATFLGRCALHCRCSGVAMVYVLSGPTKSVVSSQKDHSTSNLASAEHVEPCNIVNERQSLSFPITLCCF